MAEFIETLLFPFSFPFMQRAFIITLLIAIPMSMLSCLVVLKGWSLMGDAVSHAVLPGIVIAYVLSIPLAIGAFCAGLFCAVSTGYIKDNSRIKEDTVLGIVFSGMFGLGIVLYVNIQTDVHLDHILFGNMLGINWNDIFITALLSLLCGGFMFFKRRDLLLYSFDSQHARAIGLPVKFLHYGLLITLSVIIVASLDAIGIILSIALLVTPGAIAFLVSRTFSNMLIIASATTISAGIIGIYLSFVIDSAPAPTIVLCLTAIFIIAFFVQQYRFAKLRKATIS
ncbi:metal ABC transporter permease [Lentilitoribacter sp. Alg239-R112]|jgi:manganese/iron transport system permease protein|uniref:metal ABC transporter permease n=1 Tax=Lentilitoribacter sp. Alg239-R112 TaxID=2305987 RepID=UPI0013A6C29C|nr:metal ABC transporter permease [Lentilitoribacter sp. Alg239-R112]